MEKGEILAITWVVASVAWIVTGWLLTLSGEWVCPAGSDVRIATSANSLYWKGGGRVVYVCQSTDTKQLEWSTWIPDDFYIETGYVCIKTGLGLAFLFLVGVSVDFLITRWVGAYNSKEKKG